MMTHLQIALEGLQKLQGDIWDLDPQVIKMIKVIESCVQESYRVYEEDLYLKEEQEKEELKDEEMRAEAEEEMLFMKEQEGLQNESYWN